jgi:hypothetical protein
VPGRKLRIHETNDFISLFLAAVLLSVVFFVARPAIGLAVILACMFFTFYLFSGAGTNNQTKL